MNNKVYATTIEQSKRLIDAGIPDETADFKYLWKQGLELMMNIFKKKRVDEFEVISRFEPSIGMISETGDIEILKNKMPFMNKDNKLETVYSSDKEIVKMRTFDELLWDQIPSWSLTALLNLLPYGGLDKVSNKYVYRAKEYNGHLVESAIEAAVDAVIWFKENKIIFTYEDKKE